MSEKVGVRYEVRKLLNFFTEPNTGEKHFKDLEDDLVKLFEQSQDPEHYYSHKGKLEEGYAFVHFCECGKYDIDRDRLLRHINWHELKAQTIKEV